MSVIYEKLNLYGLTKLDKQIIKDITDIINDNEVMKDQFELYVSRILEKELPLMQVFEDDCAKGTLVAEFYHQDFADEFMSLEVNKKAIKENYMFVKEFSPNQEFYIIMTNSETQGSNDTGDSFETRAQAVGMVKLYQEKDVRFGDDEKYEYEIYER